MASVEETCVALLVGALGVDPDQARSHPFTQHVIGLDRQAQRARLAYPFLYLAIGVAFVLALLFFDAAKPDAWNKLFGAIVGVFSALLVFWKPSIQVTQADCAKLLGGKRLTGPDLAEFNRALALPAKDFENVVKLVSALASFLAIYLVLGR